MDLESTTQTKMALIMILYRKWGNKFNLCTYIHWQENRRNQNRGLSSFNATEFWLRSYYIYIFRCVVVVFAFLCARCVFCFFSVLIVLGWQKCEWVYIKWIRGLNQYKKIHGEIFPLPHSMVVHESELLFLIIFRFRFGLNVPGRAGRIRDRNSFAHYKLRVGPN